jgi:hypothetical protein
MEIEIVARMTVSSDVNVVATKYGPFAVHRTLRHNGTQGESWTITHIRTGYAAVTSLWSKADALRLARKLTSARLNWRFTRAERLPKRTRERGKAIVVAFRGWA